VRPFRPGRGVHTIKYHAEKTDNWDTMDVNVGHLDSLIRIAIGGSVVIYAAGLVSTPLNFLAMALSLIVLATGLTGIDPVYSLLGLNSAEKTRFSPPKQ